MSNPQSKEFKKIIDDWKYITPCFGANVTIYDSDFGYSDYACGYKSINPEQDLETKELFYIYKHYKDIYGYFGYATHRKRACLFILQ